MPGGLPLSGWSRQAGLIGKVLSAQAWHQRLRQRAPWLLWLFAEVVDLRGRAGCLLRQQRLLLVDVTHLTKPGPKRDTWNLHCVYTLLTAQLAWVHVTDQHPAEGFAHLPMQPGDLLVEDGSDSRTTRLIAVDTAQAFSLTRFSPPRLPVSAPQAPNDTPPFHVNIAVVLPDEQA